MGWHIYEAIYTHIFYLYPKLTQKPKHTLLFGVNTGGEEETGERIEDVRRGEDTRSFLSFSRKKRRNSFASAFL